MARTVFNVNYNCDFEKANNIISNILINKGFKQTNYNGEEVWKKGNGIMTGMQFVKVEFDSNTVVLSAWIQVGLGNVGGNEMDLTGFVGAVPKKSLMKVLEKIKNSL